MNNPIFYSHHALDFYTSSCSGLSTAGWKRSALFLRAKSGSVSPGAGPPSAPDGDGGDGQTVIMMMLMVVMMMMIRILR
jgi:hypothetical protein